MRPSSNASSVTATPESGSFIRQDLAELCQDAARLSIFVIGHHQTLAQQIDGAGESRIQMRVEQEGSDPLPVEQCRQTREAHWIVGSQQFPQAEYPVSRVHPTRSEPGRWA